MELELDRTRWYHRIAASFVAFTALRFIKAIRLHRCACYSLVEWWPLTGWITGAVAGSMCYFCGKFMDPLCAVTLALLARMAVSGARSEHDLARWVQAMWRGGLKPEPTYNALKNKKLSPLGIITLITYMVCAVWLLSRMPCFYAACLLAVADPFAKMVASQIVMMLPYLGGVGQRAISTRAGLLLAVQGLLPMLLFCSLVLHWAGWQMMVFAPCMAMYGLYLFIRHCLVGYNFVCLGAISLLVELTLFISQFHNLTID